MKQLLGQDVAARGRDTALTMAAVLLSFGSAWALRRAAGLSPSVEVLAVALALSLSRVAARPEHRGSLRRRAAGLLVLPLVALGASEIGQLLFRHPDLGDALFVAGVSMTVWVRRFGPRVRQMATFAVLPLMSVLIVPGPAVVGASGADASRWWSALVAVIALAWVTIVRWLLASHPGEEVVVEPARAAPRARREGEPRRRMLGTTKMAIQMAAALAAGFAVGRWLFSPHWSWCVLTAFIVSSGNRGREDVLHKAVLRLAGAAAGTLGATLISGLFPAGDGWAILVIFAVLAVAFWLRPLNYAFWAAGMTAALALLYGYYGEHGVSMLGSRLEAIGLGAVLAVAAAWLLWPIRTPDIMRRDIGAAAAALDRWLVALAEEPDAVGARWLAFRRAVATLEYHGTLLRAIPAPMRRRIDHLPAVVALEQLGQVRLEQLEQLGQLGQVRLDTGAAAPRAAGALRRRLGALRKANGEGRLPDPAAWSALAADVTALAADVTALAEPVSVDAPGVSEAPVPADAPGVPGAPAAPPPSAPPPSAPPPSAPLPSSKP